jgi:methylated-DNA-protein-cysteine methyltransferase-like protein
MTRYSDSYRRIWSVVRRIPEGRVATYGQVAVVAGLPGQARQVGYALHQLPDDADVPWHRVINARGEISLRSGPMEGDRIQAELLAREGVSLNERGRIDLERYQWRPRSRRSPKAAP